MMGTSDEGRHAFFIIGAPTTQTVADLKTAFDDHGKGLTLFIEADLKTFMQEVAKDNPDVYKIPTNVRAPYRRRPGVPNSASYPIVLGGIKLDSFPEFMECQEMISQSLQAILEFAHVNGIPTYFPIVGRKQRPIHFQVSPEGDSVVALPPDKGPRALHPGSDQELSSFVLKEMVQPVFEKAGRSLLDDLKTCTSHNATYLADVLAVIIAEKLTTVHSAWERWNLTSCEVLKNGIHSKVIFGDKAATDAAKNVPYCKADFVPDPKGQFYSMDSTNADFDPEMLKEIVREMMLAFKNGTLKPVWDTCHVAHDAFALDVDDLVALVLAKVMTKPGGFTEVTNWCEDE